MLDKYTSLNLFETLPDLEAVTYQRRTPTNTPGAADTFTGYSLYYAKRRPATKDDAGAAGIVLDDEYVVFMLFQRDLNNGIAANAQPYLSDEVKASDYTWVIVNVVRHQTQYRWDCLCRRSR